MPIDRSTTPVASFTQITDMGPWDRILPVPLDTRRTNQNAPVSPLLVSPTFIRIGPMT